MRMRCKLARSGACCSRVASIQESESRLSGEAAVQLQPHYTMLLLASYRCYSCPCTITWCLQESSYNLVLDLELSGMIEWHDALFRPPTVVSGASSDSTNSTESPQLN